MCRVACLEWTAVNERIQQRCRGQVQCLLLSETLAAKETKNWLACNGNHLGCRAEEGLQCGLSGNPVSMLATHRCGI